MVFGFGSSSSSSSSSKPADGAPPTRQERQRCWTTRDAYYACLDKHDIMSAGEGDGAGAALGDKEGVCADFRKAYESSCGKSWIDYFNKRRILEFRQAKTLAEAARQREEAARR